MDVELDVGYAPGGVTLPGAAVLESLAEHASDEDAHLLRDMAKRVELELAVPVDREQLLDAQYDNAKIMTFTVEQICALVYSACGAATVPFMRDHPDYVMPSEEIRELVEPILVEAGIDPTRVRGYLSEEIREDPTRIPDGKPRWEGSE